LPKIPRKNEAKKKKKPIGNIGGVEEIAKKKKRKPVGSF
jgi:hypothetical protein